MTKKRKLLLALLGIVFAANGSWLLNYMQNKIDDVELESTHLSESVQDGSAARLPMFDPIEGRWLLEGRILQSLTTQLSESNPGGSSAHGNYTYLMIRLSRDTNVDDFRAMADSIVSAGICLVGTVDPTEPVDESGSRMTTINRIVAVRADNGERRECHDLFNP